MIKNLLIACLVCFIITIQSSDVDAQTPSNACQNNTTDEGECKNCCDCLDGDALTRRSCRNDCAVHDFSLNSDFIHVNAPSTLGPDGNYSTALNASSEQACKKYCDGSDALACGDRRYCRDACNAATFKNSRPPISKKFTNKIQTEQVLSLQQAVTIALKNNPGFAQQVNGVKSAEVSVSQQQADFYPNLVLEASGSERFDTSEDDSTGKTESRSVTSMNVGLSSSLNLFNGFGDIAALKNSELLLQAELESLSQAEQTLIFETVSQFIQVLTAQELIHVEELNLEENNELLERVKSFYEAGKVPISDLYQQQAETKQAELDLLEAEHRMGVRKLLLMQTMGMIPTVDYQVKSLDVETLALIVPDDDASYLTVLALENRSDIKAQEQQVEATGEEIRKAKAGHLPTVDLKVSLGTDYSGLSDEDDYSDQFNDFLDEFVDENLNSTIGIMLTLPIFDHYETRKEILTAQIGKRDEQSILVEKKLQVGLEIAEAVQDYQKTRKQVDVFESKLTYARQALHSYEERYRVGAATLIELTDVRSQYVTAASDQVQAKYDLVTQEIAVAYYIGNMKQMLTTLLQGKN